VSKSSVPEHLKDSFSADKNDLTTEVLKNLAWLGVEYLIPIGGDDTLSYGVRLHDEGFKVIGIPKTMDNDVPGTDYCIGFSTCVTRTIHMTNDLRTSAGSHERFMVLEVFGRYAGFSAMLPTMAGAANRCVIPEHKFNIEQLAELLSAHMSIEMKAVLERIRYTTTQTAFDRAERMENLHGAFRLRKKADVRDLHVLLIDDVLTTGSTLSECARVLKKAGALSVHAATAARA